MPPDLFNEQLRTVLIMSAAINLLCIFGSVLISLAISGWIKTKTRAGWQHYVVMFSVVVILTGSTTAVTNTLSQSTQQTLVGKLTR